MKKINQIILAMLIAFTFSACEKDKETQPAAAPAPATGAVLFYSSDFTYHWSLIVDGKSYGSVGRSHNAPACGNSNFQNMGLSAGKHIMEYPSLSGLASLGPDTITVIAGQCSAIDVR